MQTGAPGAPRQIADCGKDVAKPDWKGLKRLGDAEVSKVMGVPPQIIQAMDDQ